MQPRYYNDQGELDATGKYVRVSTILAIPDKPELDANNLALAEAEGVDAVLRRREDAGKRGRMVHEACEQYVLTGDIVTLADEYEAYFRGFREWFDKMKPESCLTEVFIVNPSLGYAGRTDLVCKIDGEYWIVDIKTSKRLDPHMGLQLAAYREAWIDTHGVKPRTAILQLAPELKRGYRWKEYNEPLFPFLSLMQYHDWRQGHRKPVEVSTWDGVTLRFAIA
jgi:hypothetical protein